MLPWLFYQKNWLFFCNAFYCTKNAVVFISFVMK